MIVVSDSSPLITLARIECFDLLRELYGRIYISTEVHAEVAVAGAGLPGAFRTAQADWIEVKPVQDAASLASSFTRYRLGAGELSAIALARELSADLVLIDDRRARRHAVDQGLAVIGCVGTGRPVRAREGKGLIGRVRAVDPGEGADRSSHSSVQSSQIWIATDVG